MQGLPDFGEEVGLPPAEEFRITPRRRAVSLAVLIIAVGLALVWILGGDVLDPYGQLFAILAVLLGAAAVAFGVAMIRREPAVPQGARIQDEALMAAQRSGLAGVVVPSAIHDGNNILLGLRFQLYELRGMHTDDGATGKVLEEMQRACDNLEAMIRRLRETTGRIGEPVFAAVALASVVHDALQLLRVSTTVRECEIETALDDDIVVVADAHRLHQLLINLILNAGEATAGQGRIEIRATEMPTSVTIEVHDDGPGFDPAWRQMILEPFTTTRDGAAGLGLWAARQCALVHGGDLEIAASHLGGGLVRVKIPRNLEPTPVHRPPPSGRKDGAPVG